ncbi:MAG TPA: hypothetical protein DD979_06320 [Gammaproteobacteria bacterium]|jgi:hypothetical protein|nr:hypothetical protein [Gammaproteobacteria bacterium]
MKSGAKMLRLLVFPLYLLSLLACDNSASVDNTDQPIKTELDPNYAGKELVDTLTFSSDSHRQRHTCLINSARALYEPMTGFTLVNGEQFSDHAYLAVSWCAVHYDPPSLCQRGLGLSYAYSLGDIGVQVYAYTPADAGEVTEYNYQSQLHEEDANGWKASFRMDWVTEDIGGDLPSYAFGLKRFIEGNAFHSDSYYVALSPRGHFRSGNLVYRTEERYTLAELLAAVGDSDDTLLTFLIRYFNAVETDLELQAINDPSLDEATRDNYLNALHAEFDFRRANANAFAGRWRALLAEQLLMVEDCLHLAQ